VPTTPEVGGLTAVKTGATGTEFTVTVTVGEVAWTLVPSKWEIRAW
jgi:hypothetical protein